MDNDAFLLISRLKISAARLGMPLDAVRFASDRTYASSVLGKFSDVADATGVLLAASLRSKLRLVASPSAAVAEHSTATPEAPRASQALRQRRKS